jgi:signal transduction histidine kinase
MRAMPEARTYGLTIKAALVLGFGATFGLWLFAGYHFTKRIDEVQREVAAVNRRYMQAQELLADVRGQVLLESLSVRDALLDPGVRVGASRQRVQEISAAIDEALRRYVPIVDSGAERERLTGLRREIASFGMSLIEVLATDRRLWREQAPQLLGRIMPKRATVMQISDDFQKLNRGAFVQQQQVLADFYALTQRRVWQMLTFALAASLAIALLATSYVSMLERDLGRQRTKERQTTDDLQRLSSKLVSAQEEERRTIARELHDEIGQVLMAMKVELALVQRRIETAGGPAQLLDEAQALSDGALHTVRDLSHLLHPAMLDDLGLPAALHSYVAGFARRHGVAVEFLQQNMHERLTPDIEAAAYRIVQEALTNVVKHAQATLAVVYVRRSEDILQLAIEDNGVGFEPAHARRGLGLIGIRERVAHLRGEVVVDSAPGKGTRLLISLPGRRRAAEAETADFDATADSADFATRPEVTLG